MTTKRHLPRIFSTSAAARRLSSLGLTERPMPPKVTSATTGPNTATEALEWTKEAINEGRYRPTKHLAERIVERGMTLDDVLTALQKGHRAEAYPDLAQRGGSTWRIFGRDPRGHQLAVGVEAYLDDKARWAILCTVIDVTPRRRG